MPVNNQHINRQNAPHRRKSPKSVSFVHRIWFKRIIRDGATALILVLPHALRF